MTTFTVNDYSGTALMIGAGFKQNETIEFFEYKSMKSISKMHHNDGNWYVIINFFSNDGLNPLKINLASVINQPSWTNDIVGADTAVVNIQDWMTFTPVNATIVNPIGSQAADASVSVALASDQFRVQIVPKIIVSSGEAATLIYSNLHSISFASNGTGPALITFNQGVNYVSIPTGTTINMDAGGIDNNYPGGYFGYNTSAAGASLIITYNEA